MNTETILAANLLPLIVYFGAILSITAVMLGAAYFLGQRHHAKAADEPFESGVVPTGDVHIRFSVQFLFACHFFCYFRYGKRFPVCLVGGIGRSRLVRFY